ncbi:MAG: hypothetical protein U0841_08710 [Chloroflexia bacterium]
MPTTSPATGMARVLMPSSQPATPPSTPSPVAPISASRTVSSAGSMPVSFAIIEICSGRNPASFNAWSAAVAPFVVSNAAATV